MENSGADGIQPERMSNLFILWGKVDALRDLVSTWRSDDKDLRGAEAKALQVALGLQAVEYERRLAALNHAQERASERDATYIGREVFDRTTQELRNLLDVNTKQILSTDDKGRERVAELARLIYMGIGMLLAVEVLLKFIKLT